MDGKFALIRSALAFFFVTLATAYLFTIGVKLTGWFTRAPELPAASMAGMGLSIILGVAVLIIGAALRRFTAAETQAALLGASAVLLAAPLAQAVTTQSFDLSAAVVVGLGFITLALGILVAVSRRSGTEE